MKKYITFELEKQNRNPNQLIFKNPYGDNPFIYNNLLYISTDMLNEKYLLNYQQNENEFKSNDDSKIINQYKSNNNDEKSKNFYNDNNKNDKNDLQYYLSRKEPSGLINIGGVCYMNSVLQCFYYCEPLTKYFLNLDKETKERFGLISKGYYELVKGLYNGETKAAMKFKEAMMIVDDTFIGNEGKDSKDVAILILTELHSELKENDNSILYYDNNVNTYDKLSVYREKIKLDEINGNKTIISSTFHFLLLYEQRCNIAKCSKYSETLYTVETDNILIFELEKIYKSINKGKIRNNTYPIISLEECLEYFISKEIIMCPRCKTKTLSTKKSFCKLPKIIIFVLSRGLNAKFTCKINFKDKIDMKRYYRPINESYNDLNTIYDLIGATFAYDWSYSGDRKSVV